MALRPSFSDNIKSTTQRGTSGKKSNSFFYARVKNILLNSVNLDLFKKANGWAGLGSIIFQPLGTTNTTDNLLAKPIFNNISKYPLINEIVLIVQAPNYDLNTDPQSQEFYYLTTVGIWNSSHHNAFPDIPTYNEELGQGKTNINLGSTFKENGNIRNLLPEEGDIIIEGRFGQSLRFSSTTSRKVINNPWSSQGEEGSPIVILRNKQNNDPADINPNPWVPVYEDFNKDGSIICLSSNQDIPLQYACKNLDSYNIDVLTGQVASGSIAAVGTAFNSALQIIDPILVDPSQSPSSADTV